MISCKIEHLAARCQQRGYTLEEVAPCIVSRDGDLITVDETNPAYPLKPRLVVPRSSIRAVKKTGGPGTELKQLLSGWFGIKASAGCSCNSVARRMDLLGPDWCVGDGMQQILATMRGEHEKRRKSGQVSFPWVEAVAKQLVRLACRRARAKTALDKP